MGAVVTALKAGMRDARTRSSGQAQGCSQCMAQEMKGQGDSTHVHGVQQGVGSQLVHLRQGGQGVVGGQ